MKKILIGVFVFVSLFTIFSIYPNVSLAGCTPTTALKGCNLNQSTCNIISGIYCCDNFNQCLAITPTSPPVPTADILCGPDKKGVDTAIGCITVLSDANTFLGQILGWSVGIGGGIAFLLILYAGFMIMSSGGNPERLKAGQELLTSAISGLILLIFSIFILKFIGVDILGLDKFGFGK